MIRVVVADDHAVVRRGLIQILAEVADIDVVAEAATGAEVLRWVQENDCDVVVLDVAMPNGGGIEILDRLRRLRPQVAVLILSVYPEDQYALRALKAGASGYLTKASAPEELTRAIRQVARGRRYITTSLAEMLAAELGREGEKEPHESLSEREYQVMCLLARGKSVSDIAGELSLSVKTVSTYRRRLLEKLELQTTADIIRYAFQHRLVE